MASSAPSWSASAAERSPRPATASWRPSTVRDERKGYRFKGTGAVYTDGDVFERGVQFYEARGTVKARERIRGIVIVSVERALPVTSPAYDLGLTEDELRESNLRRLTARPAEPHVPQDP